MRKVLQISDITNLKEMIPSGAFRMAGNATVNPNVLGAWIRLCQLAGNDKIMSAKFEKKYTTDLIHEIKSIMCCKNAVIQRDLKNVMEKYGIDFQLQGISEVLLCKDISLQKVMAYIRWF